MILQFDDPMLFFTGTYLIAIVIGFALNIAICIWVYRDAESRGMNGVMWLLVVLISGCIGCIIYLIIRKDNPPM